MGLWKPQGSAHQGFNMELYIETLTGTVFELRVTPYESIQDVKARIQKLEGIPMSQQHLIWQAQELEDDYTLHDYAIQDGATLKLVLTMRGGPINTRRVPVEDASLRDMAEYFSEANKEELLDRLPNHPVTVIVYQNGDQVNFFRVVDRDAANSPTSESLSGASMYNLYDEEEDETTDGGPKDDDNDRTKIKMKLLRAKMENMLITKKPKPPTSQQSPGSSNPSAPPPNLIPHPPSAGPARPHSMSRLRHRTTKPLILNRPPILPPVGSSSSSSGVSGSQDGDQAARRFAQVLREKEEQDQLEQQQQQQRQPPLTSVKEDENEQEVKSQQDVLEAILRRQRQARKWDYSSDVLLKESSSVAMRKSPRERAERTSPELAAAAMDNNKRPISTSTTRGLERLWSEPGSESGATGAAGGGTKRQVSLEALAESLNVGTSGGGSKPSSSSRTRGGGGGGGGAGSSASGSVAGPGVILESLNLNEVRAMSGLLSSYVHRTSAVGSRSRGNKEGRRTPDTARSRRMSGRGRLSPRLAPMKHKKKGSKRCFLCSKKTGLATSYPCRCGENFCASHRYAESHSCTFDYKTEGRKLLQQTNPVVTAPKLPKI